MKLLLITFFVCVFLNASAQEITSFQDEIPVDETNILAISMDSTNVIIKYWEADYILVNTDLAYQEEMRGNVFETPPVLKFGVESVREETGKILVREKETSNLDTIGQLHTLYLPHRIESVEWVINIPSSL